MKNKIISLTVLIILTLLSFPVCYAETIYFPDGRVLKGRILYRNKSSLWFNYGNGSFAIDMRDIDKIENDDGSISRYDLRGLSKKAEEYIKQNNYTQAIELYDVLIKTFPENKEIYHLRGMLRHKVGDLDGAAADYNFLLNHEAVDFNISNNLGIIYALKKEYEKAKEYMGKAVLEEPDSLEAHSNLAKVFLEAKEYESAIQEYNKVNDLDAGNNIGALDGLAVIYTREGNYAFARKYWDRILEIQPENNRAKEGIEKIRLQSGDSVNKVE